MSLIRYVDRTVAAFVASSAFVFPALAADKASIPDLSGIWGRNWFHLEQPSSGPGPITGKLRNPDGRFNLLGLWVGDFSAPILKPEAAETVRRLGNLESGGKAFPNPHSQCWPEPTPFALGVQLGIQILQQKDEVILLYVADHQVRHVRMNMPHPRKVTASWEGDAVGHYEGDTLVIDTVGQKVGPFSMADAFGTPFSPALHVIERYRLIDGEAARDAQRKHESNFFPGGAARQENDYARGDIDSDPNKKGLQVEITVDDPNMFTTPWKALVTYRHVLGDWGEAVCAENTREFGSDGKPPVADKPDF